MSTFVRRIVSIGGVAHLIEPDEHLAGGGGCGDENVGSLGCSGVGMGFEEAGSAVLKGGCGAGGVGVALGPEEQGGPVSRSGEEGGGVETGFLEWGREHHDALDFGGVAGELEGQQGAQAFAGDEEVLGVRAGLHQEDPCGFEVEQGVPPVPGFEVAVVQGAGGLLAAPAVPAQVHGGDPVAVLFGLGREGAPSGTVRAAPVDEDKPRWVVAARHPEGGGHGDAVQGFEGEVGGGFRILGATAPAAERDGEEEQGRGGAAGAGFLVGIFSRG